MKIKQKKAVETPAQVKQVVQQIASTPLTELASVLRGFKWTFDKGDINQWVPVLDHFDSFYEEHTSKRADVQLKVGEQADDADARFPTENCLAVLNTTCLLLENCSNKATYNSSEHVSNLLAAPVPEVVAAALQLFQVLLRKTHHTPVRWTPPVGLSKRLLSVSKGWGGKEEGLDIVVCTSKDETAVQQAMHKVTTLHFEFSAEQAAAGSSSAGSAAAALSQTTTLHVQRLDGFTESEHDILAGLICRYNVPPASRFELLCRIRIARNFGTLPGRRQLVKQRLMAFNVLLQCSPSPEDYSTLYLAEPDFVSELVALVQAEEAVDDEELRTLALRALALQLHDRSRSSSVITGITTGGQSGLLSMLLHKSIASILQQANVPLVPSGSGVLLGDVAAAAVAAATSGIQSGAGTSSTAAAAAAPPLGSVQYSVAFVDALLSVVAGLVQSTSGCQALNDAGVISALLPLLRDMHTDHMGLVCASLKILEAYMDLSQPASTTFRDLGGLTEVVKRLAAEVGALPSSVAGQALTPAAGGDGDVVMAGAEQQQRPLPAASDMAAVGAKQLSHNRKTLLKFLLRTIALSSYAPTGNLTATRPQDEDAQLLYASLKEMYSRPDEFGGSLFSLAVSVMTDLIHHEPQSFRQLQEAGLPDAFLAAIKAGVLPSGDAIVTIPSALVALCLNQVGLRRVRETTVLNVLVDIFTSKKTMRVLTSDTPAILGSGLEELLRFVPSLRSDGIDVVLAVFKALCILGGDADEMSEAEKPLPPQASAATEEPAAAGAATEAAPPQPMDTDAPADASAASTAADADQQSALPAAAPEAADALRIAPAEGSMDMDNQAAAAAPAAAAGAAPEASEPAAPAAADPQILAPVVAAGAGAPAPTAAQLAAQRERESERHRQQVEDARLSAVAKRALAEVMQQVVKSGIEDADIEVFLPLALTAASRMLEPLLTNAESSRLFVERGGADVLLKLYKLPKLTPVFNFSSASHSLLSVFRALSGSHGAAIAAKSKDAVAEQLALLLPQAEQLGAVCIPTLSAEVREPYIKQMLVVQGLVALTSAVARNVTAMLPQVSMGDPPLLANMGKLERIVMAQTTASDPWKQARDVAKKEAAAAAAAEAEASNNGEAGTAAPAVVADEAAAGVEAVAAAAPANVDMDAGDEDMEGAGAEAAGAGVAAPEVAPAAPSAGGSATSTGKQKRTPEDTAYDSLSYLLTSLRTFYMGTAKAIHTPVRRREETTTAPSVPMKAAALNLALLLVGNLQLRPWDQQTAGSASAPTAEGSSVPDAGSSSGSSKQQLDAAIAAVRGRSGHYLRLAEELSQVLFDSRRHYCHLLVLNYFSALGGMQVLALCFNEAAGLLWQLMDAQEGAKGVMDPASPGDQPMADAQAGSSDAPVSAEAPAAPSSVARSQPGTAGTKDPRTVMEAVLVKFLSIYEQLANSTVLLSTPQAANMLMAALPNYAGQPLVPPPKDPMQFVNQLHSHILSAVLPLWSHPKAAHGPAGLLTAIIRVLQTCAQGPGNASLVLRYQQAGRPAAPRVQPQPDPQIVQTIVEMGFTQARSEEALRRVGANSVELAMEWLINHPEEPAAPGAGAATAVGSSAAAAGAQAAGAEAVDEEAELTRALLASLSVVGMSPDAVAQRSQHQQAAASQPADTATAVSAESPGRVTAPTAAAGTAEVSPVAEDISTPQATPHPVVPPGAPQLRRAPAAEAVGTAVPDTPESGQAAVAPTASGAELSCTGLPAPAQLVDGAVRLVAASPSTAFAISDLLLTMAQREEGKGREALLVRLLDACLPLALSSDPAAAGSSAGAAATATAPGDLLTPARLLLLLLHKDSASRRLAAKLGLVSRCLRMLQNWQEQYRAAVQAVETSTPPPADAVKQLEVPVWVEANLMLLDLMVTTQQRSGVVTSATGRVEGTVARAAAARAAVAAARAGTAPPPVPAAPAAAEAASAEGAAPAAGPASGAAVRGEDVQMADEPTPAEGAAAAQPPETASVQAAVAADAASDAAASGVVLPAELAHLTGLSSLLTAWKPCGVLDDQQQQEATTLCMTLLQQLHDHADKWEQPATSMFEADGSLPNPSSVTQALLQLLAHLTKRFSNAQQVLAAGGHRLLLSLPSACLSPTVSRQEGNIGAILRNLLEDPTTLESWMESEIKNSMTVKGTMRDPYTGRPYAYNQANPSSRYTTAASFLSMMSSLVNRDPAVFLQAVARTCALETRGETMVRLKTAKELQQPLPAQQQPGAVSLPASRDPSAAGAAHNEQASGRPSAGAAHVPHSPATARTSGPGGEAGMSSLLTPRPADAVPPDSNAGSSDRVHLVKSASKANRKLVPGTFVEVVDALLDVVLSYQGAPKPENQQKPSVDAQQQQQPEKAGTAAMELDATASTAPVAEQPAPSAPAGLEAPTSARVSNVQDVAPLPADLLLRKLSPQSREVGIQAMVLRLLSDYCLLFNNSVGLLLKRDSEGGPSDVRMSGHHHHAQQTAGQDSRTPSRRSTRASTGGSSTAAARHSNQGAASAQQVDTHKAGVVLKHIMEVQLVDHTYIGTPAGSGVAANAASLLQAVCIRSGEGRRRVITELVAMLGSKSGNDSGKIPVDCVQTQLPYIFKSGSPAPVQVAACVSLMGALVSNGGSSSRTDPRQPQGGSMSVEVVRAMREAGAVKALAQTLQLINTEHPQAKDAINAILKPLEVLTRPLPKVAAPPAETTIAPQAEARATTTPAARRTAAPVGVGAAAATRTAAGRGGGSAAIESAAAPATQPASGAAATAGANSGATGRSSGESGGRAAMDEDSRQRAGEEAAGPDALAAAGRVIPGGAAQHTNAMPGALNIDNIMDQLVDIEVELGGSDDDDIDDDSDDDDSDEGTGSDEDMEEGDEEQHEEEHGGAAGEGGGIGDAPSLTEDESDDDDIINGNAGAAFIEAAAAAAAGGNAAGHDEQGMGTSEEDDEDDEPSSDDDDHPDHHHHHQHAFEDELLAADEEIQMLQEHLDGHAQQGDGLMDPMDDDDDDEEEEEEYLDEEASDEEGWDQDAMAGALDIDDVHMGGPRFNWDNLEQLGDLPVPMMVPTLAGGINRMTSGRRVMYRPAVSAAAAGVWDDADGDGLPAQDIGAVPMTTVQMLLSQLGINAGGGPGSVALMGPNGRQYRLSALALPNGAEAGAAPQGSDAVNGAITSAMQSLTMQLLPPQHRLLALPPRLPVAESAALLASATGTGGAATAAGGQAALRGQASNVNALTRLLTRAPETGVIQGAGRPRMMTAGGRAGPGALLFNPSMPPFGPGVIQFDLLQQGGLLANTGNGLTNMLGEIGDSVWDEAVNQLLDALAPSSLNRQRLAGVTGGQGGARAGNGAAEDTGIDPRQLESHMLSLLRAQAPPTAESQQQQQQTGLDAAGAATAAAVVPPPPPPPATAAATMAVTEAGSAEDQQAAAHAEAGAPVPSTAEVPQSSEAAVSAATAEGAVAGRRTLTEQAIAAALQAAMSDSPAALQAAPAHPAEPAPPAAFELDQLDQPPAQPQQQAGAAISSHPVDVAPSAPESPAAADAGDQATPMDTEDAGPQPSAPAAAVEVMDAEGAGVEAAAQPTTGVAATGDGGDQETAIQEALRQAADAAGIDYAFLEALPAELRVEVLSAQGVELRLPQPRAAPAPAVPVQPAVQPATTLAAAELTSGASADVAAAPAAAAAPSAGDDAAQPAVDEAAIAPPAAVPEPGAAAAAVPAPPATASAEDEEPSIDPEFLAALPPDIREEVLAQERAERRARASAARAAARQGQQEMSLADLLAAMDDDARADAFTQLNDSDLAQLPPQMRAQAQALRERVARQMQAQQQAAQQQAAARERQRELLMNRELGAPIMGGTGRLVLPMGPDGLPMGRSFFGTVPGALGGPGYRGAPGRAELLEAAARAAEEPEGPPILDEADLVVLVGLLRVTLPLSKHHLQKLFLNLAGHSSTREQLLKMLLGLLRSLPGSATGHDAGAAAANTTGSQPDRAGMDISEDEQQSQQDLSVALDAAALNQPGAAGVSSGDAATSAASAVGSSAHGKPAVVSRRVLDMLQYLSRQSQPVSRQMLSLRVTDPAAQPPATDKGKGKMPVAIAEAEAPRAVEVLFATLSAPLCQRSVSLLEQVMLLMEVVLTQVQRYEADQQAIAELLAARKKQEEEQQQKRKQEERQQAAESTQQEQQVAGAQQEHQQEAQQADSAAQEQQGRKDKQGQQAAASSKQQQQQQQQQPTGELATTLAGIQPELLQQLPALLAREALSEPAYVSIAKVIKLIVESAPVHLPLMLSQLVEGAAGVAHDLLGFLDTAAEKGIDADAQLAPAIGTKSGVVLRMLHALQGFQSEVKAWVKQREKERKEQEPAAAAAADTAAGASTSNSAQTAVRAGSGSRSVTAPGASSSAQAGSSRAVVHLPSNLNPEQAAAEVDKAVDLIATRTAMLWKSLSSCILRIEDNLRAVLPAHMQAAGESAGNAAARLLPPGAQQVLPLVEAFFVLCALQDAIPPPPSQAKDLLSAPSLDVSLLVPAGASQPAAAAGGVSAAAAAPRGATPPPPAATGVQMQRLASTSVEAAAGSGDGSLPFLRFSERHRRLLNAYIRRNTGLLESSLAPLLRVPKLIDFDNKRAYFRSRVRAPEARTYAGSLRLAVKRSTVFEDSFNKLRSKTPEEMRGKLSVSFMGEEGIDAGGVSREWYQVMAREIFNPNLALFVSVPEGGTTFQPNPNSIVQSDTGVSHLEFFKFVGRLVGKALYDGQIMDAYFTRSFYKHMLGQPLTYEDIEAVDPEYYKNLKWMLENDITDVLDLTFTAESDFFGKTEIVELVPGGREIKVTEANKHEYVNLIARHRMTTSIKPQIQAFLEGFWQLVPRELISMFNDHELELLISGLPDIDVADLRANTEYSGFSPNSPVIQWFWQVVADLDKQDLALLLQFVTGTSKVPLGGFRSLQGISGPQRFQIHKSYGATDRLPSAHTCFNQLDLPEYESKEQLAERLAMAIHEGHEGFGFG